jgi:hypothetical protein
MTYPAPDLTTLERIRELLDADLPALFRTAQKEGQL